MKTKNTIASTIKFPEPKPIDYRKYIQPMHQDFEIKNGFTTAILKPLNK